MTAASSRASSVSAQAQKPPISSAVNTVCAHPQSQLHRKPCETPSSGRLGEMSTSIGTDSTSKGVDVNVVVCDERNIDSVGGVNLALGSSVGGVITSKDGLVEEFVSSNLRVRNESISSVDSSRGGVDSSKDGAMVTCDSSSKVVPSMNSFRALEDRRTEMLITQAKSILTARAPELLSATKSPLDILFGANAETSLVPSKDAVVPVSKSSVNLRTGLHQSESCTKASRPSGIGKLLPITPTDRLVSNEQIHEHVGKSDEPALLASATSPNMSSSSCLPKGTSLTLKGDVEENVLIKDTNENVIVSAVSTSGTSPTLSSALSHATNPDNAHVFNRSTMFGSAHISGVVQPPVALTTAASVSFLRRSESIRSTASIAAGENITAQIQFARSCSRPVSQAILHVLRTEVGGDQLPRPRSEVFHVPTNEGSTNSLHTTTDAIIRSSSSRRSGRPSPRSLYNLNEKMPGWMSGSGVSMPNWSSCLTPTASGTSSPCTTPTVSNPPSLAGSAAGFFLPCHRMSGVRNDDCECTVDFV